MTVDYSNAELVADRVWFDAVTGRLCLQAGDYVNGIEFSRLPDDDFESASPVISFSLGQHGAVVVCHHRDGLETWLPVDLWLPEGFTPAAGV